MKRAVQTYIDEEPGYLYTHLALPRYDSADWIVNLLPSLSFEKKGWLPCMLRGRRRQFLSVILMLIIDTCREESERKSKQGDDSVVVRVTTDDKSECQVRSHAAQSQSFFSYYWGVTHKKKKLIGKIILRFVVLGK